MTTVGPAGTGVWTIVVAAGTATRFGRPKQYELLGGRRVLDWAVEAARAVSEGIVLVVAAEALDRPEPGVEHVVAGGDTRSASVRAGLAAVPLDARVVLVHDAARPLASAALFQAVLAAVLAGADAAVPAVPVTDTLRRVVPAGPGGGAVDRTELVAVQTPQGFPAEALRRAHEGEPDATDDAGLVESAGGRVVLVAGETANLKLTGPDDIAVLGALLARRAPA